MPEAVRGRAVSIVAADTDTNVVQTPTGKEFLVTRMLLSNYQAGVSRVRVWDTFTDVDGTVHSSTAEQVKMVDRNLAAGESVEEINEDGLFTLSGLAVARATAAAADPNDVVVGLWGHFR